MRQAQVALLVGVLLAGPLAASAQQNAPAACGWIGVEVRPMTVAFAQSLGMSVPYGAIFDSPKPGGPAAIAKIEAGDVLTAIEGTPLTSSAAFAPMISRRAPGAGVDLTTWRNGQLIMRHMILGSSACPALEARPGSPPAL
jgi:S1-C subfamily serine protease